MTERQPLWATGLASEYEPQPDYVEIFHENEPEDEPPEEQPPQRPGLTPGRLLAVGIAMIVVLTGLSYGFVHSELEQVRVVPSYWGDIPMTCHTTRLEDDAEAVELFACDALEGQFLPTGVYESPEAQWISDLTRQEALASHIVIDAEGHLEGLAVYRPTS